MCWERRESKRNVSILILSQMILVMVARMMHCCCCCFSLSQHGHHRRSLNPNLNLYQMHAVYDKCNILHKPANKKEMRKRKAVKEKKGKAKKRCTFAFVFSTVFIHFRNSLLKLNMRTQFDNDMENFFMFFFVFVFCYFAACSRSTMRH